MLQFIKTIRAVAAAWHTTLEFINHQNEEIEGLIQENKEQQQAIESLASRWNNDMQHLRNRLRDELGNQDLRLNAIQTIVQKETAYSVDLSVTGLEPTTICITSNVNGGRCLVYNIQSKDTQEVIDHLRTLETIAQAKWFDAPKGLRDFVQSEVKKRK